MDTKMRWPSDFPNKHDKQDGWLPANRMETTYSLAQRVAIASGRNGLAAPAIVSSQHNKQAGA